MHARNIYGEVVKSFTERPPERIPVLTLGKRADSLADAFGHTPSTILRLHQTYLEARYLSSPSRYFINEMVSHGMPRREASLYWDMIIITPSNGSTSIYRERMSLDVD